MAIYMPKSFKYSIVHARPIASFEDSSTSTLQVELIKKNEEKRKKEKNEIFIWIDVFSTHLGRQVAHLKARSCSLMGIQYASD